MTRQLAPRDIEDVRARGLAPEEVLRQWDLLASPPPPPALARPCRINDGILPVKPEEAAPLVQTFNRAREEGRLSKFVPASGAATRMFKSLLSCRASSPDLSMDRLSREAETSPEAAETLKLIWNLRHFPFYEPAKEALRRKGLDPVALLRADDHGPWIDALIGREGLDLASKPKGVIPFHRYKDAVKTAFEEHLIESVDFLRDEQGACRLHFTISPEHEGLFSALASEVVPRLEKSRRCRFLLSFSRQKPSTDTVALDEAGAPARTPDGKILFRPGGHGALLDNLNELKADVVFIKNIDNVPHESHPGESAYWEAVLGGFLLELQEEMFRRLSWLTSRPNDPRILAEAEFFAARRLNILRPSQAADEDEKAAHRRRWEWLTARLNRPLRVCGAVKNTGEPGGGPFWVRGKDGELAPQIVEAAQVSDAPDQKRIFLASTHFNPVHMVCALKDWRGAHFDLHRFADPSAVFVARKSVDGRPLRVLERPGLWNGGMAGWTTVFVETPLSTFHPVKTVNDLLRADHQPAVAEYASREAP